MAPTSSTEHAHVKHITLHQFLKQQQLLQHRLKPAVMWGWPATAGAISRHVPEDVAEDDDALGWAWPPRSYTCAFCRREFKSAQALGGHMNVHRRDRARMREGHHGGSAAAQLQLGGAATSPATDEMPHATTAAAKYAVLYPILNSNAAGAVLIPSGDAMLSGPVALAPAHDRCHVSDDDDEEEEDNDVVLELRLWWP